MNKFAEFLFLTITGRLVIFVAVVVALNLYK